MSNAAVDVSISQRLGGRAAALAGTVLVLSFATWAGGTLYRCATDAWIAPIHLSPENDAVLHARRELARELAERDRLRVEVEHASEQVAAIDIALKRLHQLETNADAAVTWAAETNGEQLAAHREGLDNLGELHRLLAQLLESQGRETARARERFATGLITAAQLEEAERTLELLKLRDLENKNARVDLEARLAELVRRERALRPGEKAAPAMLPERVEQEQQRIRLELERVKLESDRRNMEALKRVAERTLAESDELLAQLQQRPLFRAMEANTDVAFVPYEQLDDVAEGGTVLACFKGLVHCRPVGQVTRVLEGEVVMEDPWGEKARGRYAILELTDATAHRERTLRVRGG